MSDIHIDDFFADAARVFDRLYASFPRPSTLFVEEISGPDEPDEFGVHSKRHLGCLHTMTWLAAENYLRFDDLIRSEAMDQAVLTARGFNLLVNPPRFSAPIDVTDQPEAVRLEKLSNIHRIRSALKARNSTAIRKAMTELLKQDVR